MKSYTIYRIEKKEILLEKAALADSFFIRLKGLLGKKHIEEEEGMIFYPCRSIHCYGMQFPIDIVFLDDNKKILSIRENIKPGSRAHDKNACYTIEMKAGVAAKKQLEAGETLEIS
ncbi:hypothetical protein SAMN05660297_02879 [Natronincola peptidivorans]|uniref:DUF192 domain-containing protein n=1 Tax=Natronincola peptidivorans TaxID=426128 RepID=A0A1I0FNI8_9FIRM|nr:DUF192 domain-containing protein [Natronincola peptidivorans]SET59653.1 hypothetical protein SAMN05660297_02879 [Natronincola peptidivorans]